MYSKTYFPAISVVLPVYNSLHFIHAAISSILQQTFPNFELILIDDGSTDGTEAIVREIAAQDPRIHLIQRENRGLIASLNEGITLAQSPLIARMDADDIALPNRLERQYAYLSNHPDTVAIGTYVQFMDEKNQVYRKKKLPSGNQVRDSFLWGCPIMHPTVMMRTDAVRKAGGYPSQFISAEDYALWLRLLSLGEIDNLPEILLSYRIHGNSISHVHAHQQRDSTLRAQALWLAGRLWDNELCQLETTQLITILDLPPETLRSLLARILSLNPHIIGVSHKHDPEAQEWIRCITQGPMTLEIRKALSLYHLRAARAQGMSIFSRLYHLGRSSLYSPREFTQKMGEFLCGRL